jgi:hypothetical protein
MKVIWEEIKWGGAALGEWLLVVVEFVIITASWD